MAKLFLSYTRSDEAQAESLVDDIKSMSLDCWRDKDTRGGHRWWTEICRNIRECDLFVFLVSPESMTSAACLAELDYAVRLGVPILPIAFDDVDGTRLPKELLELHIFKMRIPSDKPAFVSLSNEIAALLSAVTPSERRNDVPAPPLPLSQEQKIRLAITKDALSEDEQKILVADIRRFVATLDDPVAAASLIGEWRSAPALLGIYRDELDDIRQNLVGDGQNPSKWGSTWIATAPMQVVVVLVLAFAVFLAFTDTISATLYAAPLLPIYLAYVGAKGVPLTAGAIAGFFLAMSYQATETVSIGFGLPMYILAMLVALRFRATAPNSPLVSGQRMPVIVVGLLMLATVLSLTWFASDTLSLGWQLPASVQVVAGLLVLFGRATAGLAVTLLVALFTIFAVSGGHDLVDADTVNVHLDFLSFGQLLTTIAIVGMAALARDSHAATSGKMGLRLLAIAGMSALAMPGLEWTGDLVRALTPSVLDSAFAQADAVIEQVIVEGSRIEPRFFLGSDIGLFFLIIFAGLAGGARPARAALAALVPVWAIEWLYQFAGEHEIVLDYSSADYLLPVSPGLCLLLGVGIVARHWPPRNATWQ